MGQISETHKIMKIRTYSVGLVLFSALLLAGCGLKGPLYMPGKTEPKAKENQPTQTTEQNQPQS